MIIVLVFMFLSSVKLTCVTFLMVPFTVSISKTYGAFYRRLSKHTQVRPTTRHIHRGVSLHHLRPCHQRLYMALLCTVSRVVGWL
jgi:ABC-type multidrug transport system fused ATPase/permease subunit